MDLSKPYYWKNLKKEKYFPISNDIEAQQIETVEVDLNNDLKSLSKSFNSLYSFTRIPTYHNDLINNLLIKYGLSKFHNQFIVIGCSLQNQYFENYNIEYDALTKDFDLQKKDFVLLIDVLEGYLFAKNKEYLKSITFKLEPSIQIKNFFVVNDVYDAICNGFGLTKDNFENRKLELLLLTNQNKVKKYGEIVKTQFIRALFQYTSLRFKDKNESDILKFIGAFCHIFQVPTNKKFFCIELYEDIDVLLKSINLPNIRHYIFRTPKTPH